MKLCKNCDSVIDGTHHTYCRYCYAYYRKSLLHSDPNRKKRHHARVKAMAALKNGLIFKHACSCGDKNSQMHHNDYDKPLDVVWYCKKCHDEFHILERKALCA